MSNKILVTDSLFIFYEHIKKLEDAGFTVERLDKIKATPEELIPALQGKAGYILGGIEEVTADILDQAPDLKAIAVCASGYTEFLQAHEYATQKGIAFSSCPGANAQAVAEYSLLLMLASIRNFKSITTPGGSVFSTGKELTSLTLGIIGLGYIGKALAKLALALGMKVIANSRHEETLPGVDLVDLPTLLKNSDVVSLHINKIHGTGVIGKKELDMMKDGAILVNTTFNEAIDSKPLREALLAGKIKFATDGKVDFKTADISMDTFIGSNAGNGFNTQESRQRMSDRATNSMINLLLTGDDPDLVNPDYKNYR